MKTSPERFLKAMATIPKATSILEQLIDTGVAYNIGGSLALYVQGSDRPPHDIDIMFTDEAHELANRMFSLTSECIERPNVSMIKSTPVDDGSIDFLSRYTVIADTKVYYTPPLEIIPVSFKGHRINLVPAEKIAVFKLIGRREHHNDLNDFRDIYKHPDFDMKLFWKIVDSLEARKIVSTLLSQYNLL